MLFTETPSNHASIREPLLYRFGDDAAPRDLKITLTDSLTEEVIFTKLLCNTSSGEIDIAPLLRSHFTPRPDAPAEGFSPAQNRLINVRVTVEEASCERRFLDALCPDLSTPLLHTLPLKRTLSVGEYDELLLLPAIQRGEVDWITAAGRTTQSYTSSWSNQPTRFGVYCPALEDPLEAIEVRLYSDSECHTLRYAVVEPSAGGMRLAWVNRRGAIEHYTFPLRSAHCEEQQRDLLRLNDSTTLLRSVDFNDRIQITSAYETHATLQALAELGTAPAVWWLDPAGDYQSVEVAAAERPLQGSSGISTLRFTLRPTHHALRLWS